MMHEILEKFLPRFAALARERLDRALDVVGARRYGAMDAVVRDLHAIAGESGLLGLAAVLDVGRRAELLARRLAASRADVDADALLVCLRELDDAVAAACAALPPSQK